MSINTNGWTIYAPEGTTLEEMIEAFEADEDLWSKVTGHNIFSYGGKTPRDWVLSHDGKSIVYTRGRDEDKIKQSSKAWRQQIVKCECGRSVTRGKLSKHVKTTVHFECLAKPLTTETDTTQKPLSQQAVKCECGRSVTRGELNKHRKTAVHFQYLAEQSHAETNEADSQNTV